MFGLRCIYSCFKTKQSNSFKIQIRKSSNQREYNKLRSLHHHRGVKFFFQKNLLLTNSITSGLFMFLGDIVQQEIEYQSKIIRKRYDWGRSVRMLTVGVGFGPLFHYYYFYLDKILPKVNLKSVLIKVLADQSLVAPLLTLGFFYGIGILERKKLNEISEEVRSKFIYVYMGDCMFWPPVQIINFYFLPTHYRVVYLNFATMIYNIFLSFMKHYDQNKDEEPNINKDGK